MSLAPFTHTSQHQLPGRFTQVDMQELYRDMYLQLSDSFRVNPALGVMHHMLAERLAYAYVRSIAVTYEPNNDLLVERSYLDAFTKLATELGKEMRAQAREGAFKQAFVSGVLMILRDELDEYPELTERIMQKFGSL